MSILTMAAIRTLIQGIAFNIILPLWSLVLKSQGLM